MPYRKIEEGFFASHEEMEDSLAGCFVEAVKCICEHHTRGKRIETIIRGYATENPNRDILPQTQMALYFFSGVTDRDLTTRLEQEEFDAALDKIKSTYFLLLPGFTAKKYQNDLMQFFKNIKTYAARKKIDSFNDIKEPY